MADKEKEKKEYKLTDLPGVGATTAVKLEEAGITDLMSIAILSPAELSSTSGLTEVVARKAIQAARKMLDLGFQDASQVEKSRQEAVRITSGSKNLDNLLGGRGVESKAITEVYGAYGSGKTQLAHVLAVTVQLPKDKGGASGKAVYIDTEGTFRPERIKQIAEGLGLDANKVMKNVMVARAFNSDHQILLSEKVGEMIKEGEPIKLLIIDSITAHFRAEFVGRGQLADRQQKLNQYLHSLIRMAEQYNVAIYITNQVMANPAVMFGDPTTAIGGHILGHGCLTADSLIQLGDGRIIELSRILSQDKVISSNFKTLKLENSDCRLCFINPSVNVLYNIRSNSLIKSSSLHRFFCIDNFKIVEKEARELKKGDFIAQASRISIEGQVQELPVIKQQPKVFKLSKEGKEKIKELGKDMNRIEICKKVGIKPRQLRRILNQDYCTTEQTIKSFENNLGLVLMQHTIPYETSKHRNILLPQILTPQLSQIFGYFLGDGNIEKYSLRFKDSRLEVLENYNQLFKNLFGINGKINHVSNKNCYQLSINSVEIIELFKRTLPFLTDLISKSQNDCVASFIKGFVDAEGYINKKRARITISQKTDSILRYLQLLLLRFGIRSFLRKRNDKEGFLLEIRDRDVVSYRQIGFSASEKQAILMRWAREYSKKYTKEVIPIRREYIEDLLRCANLKPSRIIKSRPKNQQYINSKELDAAINALLNQDMGDLQIRKKINFLINLRNSDIRFERIRKIWQEKNSQPMYDLEIGHENYIANGFITHNSTYRLYFRRGKAGSRVAKMIDSPNLPESETIFYITTAGLKDEEEK
ncbi:DNA repair and recombination protein RadA [Candidatus Pacearchaeota archaeon]|nr:DNA repair and recombination protein RadA [Candidatus Pacearchaeota archaeon]